MLFSNVFDLLKLFFDKANAEIYFKLCLSNRFFEMEINVLAPLLYALKDCILFFFPHLLLPSIIKAI